VVDSRKKAALRAWLSKSPIVERFAKSIHRRLEVSHLWFRSFKRRLRDPTLPDPDEIFWIDPNLIVRHTNFIRSDRSVNPEDRVFDTVADKGKVYGGDWDISTYQFTDLAVYKAIEERILKGRDWSETAFYQNLSENISDRSPWRIRSRDDLDMRCAYLDELIISIKNDGFRLAHEVVLNGEERSIKHHRRFGNYVTVNISRSGEFLFQDGRHRLAIARVLGIQKIPVKVLVRHADWVTARCHYLNVNGKVDQDIEDKLCSIDSRHPDLQEPKNP